MGDYRFSLRNNGKLISIVDRSSEIPFMVNLHPFPLRVSTGLQVYVETRQTRRFRALKDFWIYSLQVTRKRGAGIVTKLEIGTPELIRTRRKIHFSFPELIRKGFFERMTTRR